MSGGRRVASKNDNFGEVEYSGERRSRRRENREYLEKEKVVKTREPKEPKEPMGAGEPPKIDPTIIFIIVTIAIVIIGFITFIVIGLKNEKNNKEKPTETEVAVDVVEENKLEDTYEGFKVLGKIKIESINVEQYILDSTSDKALKAGVGKVYGGVLNGSGNLSIAGHNEEGKFKDLEELDKGDKFVVVDRKLNESTYKITDITTVEADDLTCLLSDESKKEITLITCQNGATSRLIVKAEKVD